MNIKKEWQGATAIVWSPRHRFDECVYETGPHWCMDWYMVAPAESRNTIALANANARNVHLFHFSRSG